MVPRSVLTGRHVSLEAPIEVFLSGRKRRVGEHFEEQLLPTIHRQPQTIHLPGPKIAEKGRLHALRAHTKASYKMDLLWKTLRHAEAA
jgi:hypothetical protein